MSNVVQFFVPGEPRGKERPRPGKNGRMYTPKKTKKYEALIEECCINQCPGRQPEYTGNIVAQIECLYPIRKSAPKKKRAEMLAGMIRPTKTPDLDNIAKAVLDAINTIAYKDDAQVVEISITKWYAPVEDAGVQVAIQYEDGEDWK